MLPYTEEGQRNAIMLAENHKAELEQEWNLSLFGRFRQAILGKR